MNKKILMTIVALFVSTIFCATVYAQDVKAPEDIRIGLYYGSSALGTITLSSPGGIEVGVMVDGEFEYIDEIPANKKIEISRGKKAGSVYVDGIGDLGSKYEYPYFKSIEDDDKSLISINGKLYRGNVEIRRFSDSDMTVINHLSMQEYLYGVVPREIGGNSPFEAVKAQAIVARTYATKNYGKRAKWGFDLYPTVDDQAYGGYTWENKNSNNAVDETCGKVIVYDGELIGGYYFSTSGGYTESSENVWVSKCDYLKAVPDIYEPEIEGNTTWEVEYTASEIKKKLASYGIDVGEIIDIVPCEYTEAGRVLALEIIGTEGTEIITKSNTRTYLGLKSQWYTVNDEAPEVKEIDEDELPINNSSKTDGETDDEWWLKDGTEDENEDEECVTMKPNYSNDEDKFTVDKIVAMKPLLRQIIESILSNKVETIEPEYAASSNKNTFTFRGRGWGHAVGMSQNGAKGMAEEGFSCEEIITWYYSGVEVID